MLLYFSLGLALIFTLTVGGCEKFIFAYSPYVNSDRANVELNWIGSSHTNTSLSEAKLNRSITIRGIAQNASLGAVVMTEDNTPIYVSGLQEWDSSIVGKMVKVTGILRRRSIAPNATITYSSGEMSHGIDGESYVLDNATWKVVRPHIRRLG